MHTLLEYNFLILSLLFLLPGFAVYALRADLRPIIHITALCSLPFALTETLFYPSYWEPRFLFDLIHTLGFGVEDLLFVVGLGAFTSTLYPALFSKRIAPLSERKAPSPWKRAATVLLAVFIGVGICTALHIPMIHASFAIMLFATAAIVYLRRDLLVPSVLGGTASLVVYTLLCVLFEAILPGIFELAWNTEQFSNITIFTIPLEELMYGFASGTAATVFYPFITSTTFAPLPHDSPQPSPQPAPSRT